MAKERKKKKKKYTATRGLHLGRIDSDGRPGLRLREDRLAGGTATLGTPACAVLAGAGLSSCARSTITDGSFKPVSAA